MASHTGSTFANRDVLLGVVFALLAAVGFSAKAILVKLAYLDHVDAVTLLALRMVFSVPFFIAVAIWVQRRHAPVLDTHDRLLVLAGVLIISLNSRREDQ